MFRRTPFEIPVKFFVEVGQDGELMELGSAGITYPYDTHKALPRLLRELAAKLEALPDDETKAR